MKLTITRKVTTLCLSATLAIGLVGCNNEEDKTDSSAPQSENSMNTAQSIPDIVAGDERFSTLLTALTEADLVDTLNSEGPFTVFAPTDAAFAKLPEGTLESLLAEPSKQKLKNILLYHVVPGRVDATTVLSSSSLSTVFGQDITVDAANLRVSGASIATTDIMAGNGIVHIIDDVMIPKNIVETASAAGLNTLVQLVELAGLTETLATGGPFTVFAPTEAAFAALDPDTVAFLTSPEGKDELTRILTYHVVAADLDSNAVLGSQAITSLQGSDIPVTSDETGAFVAGAKINTVDIKTFNGTVHVIESVMIPGN